MIRLLALLALMGFGIAIAIGMNGCAGQKPIVIAACADLAPLQPLVKEASLVVPSLAARIGLEMAQSAEQGVCLNPAQAQAMIDQLNAAIAAKVHQQHAARAG